MAENQTYLEAADVFQSFTGADIRAIATIRDAGAYGTGVPKTHQKVISTLNSITVSVVREINPIWAMGKADFSSVSKGKRSISGTMTFVVFDRDPLVRDLVVLDDLKAMQSQFVSMIGSNTTGQWQSGEGNRVVNGMANSIAQQGVGANYLTNALAAVNNLYTMLAKQPIRYADQLAPFDITISFINDQGAASVASVRQIYVVSQGFGVGMGDMENNQVYTYIARFYEPMASMLDNANMSKLSYDALNPS